MKQEPMPTTVTLRGEVFDIVKPTRLLPGMVLKSKTRDVYARLGPKDATLEEQTHTVSLYKRGFPVARVLDSGEYGNGEWYFVEESLGEEPFHTRFAREWSEHGAVTNETFSLYRNVVKRYIAAQFHPANHTTVSAEDFVLETIPDEQILANYQACGGNIDRYHEAIALATKQLTNAPMGILQLDLNPYNILDRGMIDFELVGYGPVGYDSLLVSLWHRWFTNDPHAKYTLAYTLSEQQVGSISQLVSAAARASDLPNPYDYLQEFLLIKTAWSFTSTKTIHQEEPSKQNFYRYRAALLTHCVNSYLSGTVIDPLTFPDIRAA